MAAPSSQSESDDDITFRDVPEHLDWRTPNFDPLRAIYDDRTPIPNLPGVKQFNNIAQFENFLMGKDAQAHKKKKEEKASVSKEKMPGIIAQRAAMQAKEAVRKAAIMEKNAGPAERSETQARRMRTTTVFTRMQGYKVGPMSMMRRCVEEKLRVVVVVRAAVAVRSRCRGYIVAFDKHFNIALMDVDEKMIKPVCRKKNKTKVKTEESGYNRNPGDQESLTTSTGTLSLGSSSLSNRQERNTQDSHQRYRTSSKERLQPKNEPMSPQASANRQDLRAQLVSKRLDSHKVPADIKTEDKRSTDYQDHYRNCLSDSNVFTQRQRKNLTDIKTSESDSETKMKSASRNKSSTDDRLKQHYQPFWPLYKSWTEVRCNSEFEIVSRHVNQLFIRGDNVVSVSLSD